MDMCIRKSFVIVTFVALAIAAASGQMNPQSARPCVAKDEVVHKAGESGVKPPRLDIYPAEQMPENVRGQFVFGVLVNSEGRVCDVQVLKASDKTAGARAAKHIADHWKFKPASLDGKGVAVDIIVNFNLGD
ncbi:MAG: energy transducer TonB [Terriglobales bacterium]|jgi:TonB family protein